MQSPYSLLAVQEILDIADHIVVLNFGTVLASGSSKEISTNTEVQKAYFGSSFKPNQEQPSHV